MSQIKPPSNKSLIAAALFGVIGGFALDLLLPNLDLWLWGLSTFVLMVVGYYIGLIIFK